MALIKKQVKFTEPDQEKTLGSGFIGLITTIVITNPTDQTNTIKIYNDDDFLYLIKTIGSKNTITIKMDTLLNDEVIKAHSDQSDCTIVMNFLENN